MGKRKGNMFVVEIKDTENKTWQGSITWTDIGRTEYFRSALELLKLIDSTLDMGEEKEDGRNRWYGMFPPSVLCYNGNEKTRGGTVYENCCSLRSRCF